MVMGWSPGPAPAELADVAEGERAQERAQGGGGHHPVAEDLAGGAGAQYVGVVDAVAAGDHRLGQGEQLAPGAVGAGAVAKVDELIDDLLDAEPLGQRRGEDQPGVGDRVGVVEGDGQGVGTVRRWHRESALRVRVPGASATPFSQLRGPFS
jgi:hypothetical protein